MGVDPEDAYTAYCLDEAARLWGRWVERQLDESEKNAQTPALKKSARVNRFTAIMVDVEAQRASGKSGFRDPAELLKRKGG